MVAVAVGPPGSSSARHLAEGLAPPEHPQGLPRDALDDGGRVTAAAYGGRLLRHVFQLLERQNLHGGAGRLGLHVHRLTGPERIRHVLPRLLRGLLHDLDLHQAGYRASADGPFLDMALYDRFQRLVGTSAPAARSASRRSSPRKATAASAESQPEVKPQRKRREMTAAEKKAVSERMTAYWAERRKKAAKK